MVWLVYDVFHRSDPGSNPGSSNGFLFEIFGFCFWRMKWVLQGYIFGSMGLAQGSQGYIVLGSLFGLQSRARIHFWEHCLIILPQYPTLFVRVIPEPDHPSKLHLRPPSKTPVSPYPSCLPTTRSMISPLHPRITKHHTSHIYTGICWLHNPLSKDNSLSCPTLLHDNR